ALHDLLVVADSALRGNSTISQPGSNYQLRSSLTQSTQVGRMPQDVVEQLSRPVEDIVHRSRTVCACVSDFLPAILAIAGRIYESWLGITGILHHPCKVLSTE